QVGVVVGPVVGGRLGEELHARVDAESGGVEDEVVEVGVGRVAAVEALGVAGPGGVGLVEPFGCRVDVDPLPGRAPAGAALDGPVESDVEGPFLVASDRRRRAAAEN